MKIIIFSLIFLITGCNATELEKVENFSTELMQIFVSQDRKTFKELPVYPNYSISEDAIIYIFGNDRTPQGISRFINSESTSIKIYGPYSRNDADGGSSYSVVYYDAQKLRPNEEGYFDSDEIRQAWGASYLETSLTIIDGAVMFLRTPFYYGTHAPWAEDY